MTAFIYSDAGIRKQQPVAVMWANYRAAQNLAKKIGCVVMDYFCDADKNRHNLEKMIDEVQRCGVDAVIVPGIASIAPGAKECAHYIRKLQSAGVKLYCVELGPEDLFAQKEFDAMIRSFERHDGNGNKASEGNS